MVENNNKEGELLQGTLDLLVLRALVRGPMHGYGVAEWIERTSDDVLKVEEGALYPALHRLEYRGLLKGDWQETGGRKLKTYRLTAKGRRHLETELSGWRELSVAISLVLGTT